MNHFQNQQELIETFEMFDDWLEKYQYIIDLGKQLPALDEIDKVDDNLLQGCQSRVWLIHKKEGNTLHFYANSDAAIVSGLIYLVLSIYSEKTAKEIIQTEPEFIKMIGLSAHLSSTRSNGLNAMIAQIKKTAADYL